MAIEFRCPSCETLLRTGDEKAGLRAKCPQCGGTVTAPKPAGGELYEEFEDYDEPDQFSRHFGGGSTMYVQPKSDNRRVRPETGDRIPCPMCGESIAATARRCRHCGEAIGAPERYPSHSYIPTAGSAVASLVLGIIGLLTFCIWFVGLPCSVLGIGLGIAGIRAARSGRYQGEGVAIAGLVLGVIGLLFCVGIHGFVLAAFRGKI